MGAFDHIILLLSFVFALALAHLLSSATEMLRERARVTFSWTHALWMANAVVLIFMNWLSIWDEHGLKHWDLIATGQLFSSTVLQYFSCSLVSPRIPEEGPIDLWQFHQRQKIYYIGAFTVLGIYNLIGNVYFWWKLGGTNLMDVLLPQLVIVPMMVVSGAAMVVKSPRLQFACAAVEFILLVVSTPLFTVSFD